MVGQVGAFCAECWHKIHFISDPLCHKCGNPFEFSIGEHAACGACMRAVPPYAAARAVFRYDEASRALVIGLKFHDRTQMLQRFGEWLARAGEKFLPECDVIVPVPLHYLRLLQRRFNQSLLLARALSRYSGVPVAADALRRRRRTLPQTGLTRAQREKNVQGAFRLNPRHRNFVRGKTVLLVDDVMTTGATLHACTRALLRGGAKNVYVLTLARTVVGE